MMIKKMFDGTTVTIMDGRIYATHGDLKIAFKIRDSKIVHHEGSFILTNKDETCGIEIDESVKDTLTRYHFMKVEEVLL